MAILRQAVSVILEFEGEIFIIRRQNHLRAFPGYTAFPGGKVEQDEDLLTCLYREMDEELGIDFKNHNSVDSIKKIALATSPIFNPRRFETYFYHIKLKNKLEFNLDENEFYKSVWLRPDSILKQWNEGKTLIVPPIRKVLEQLSRKNLGYVDYDLDRDELMPAVEVIKNIIQIMPKSNTLPPAERTNSFVIGDKTKVLVDPSPKDEKELFLYLNRIAKYNIVEIFITHHHPDHHQFSNDIARKLGVPLSISEDTCRRIKRKWGEGYFSGITLNIRKEGDILCQWLGKNVLIYEIPGHDEGHLGLAPDSLEWFLVGDLFQGMGSVVIGDDEGDMTKYFDSLKRVIKLDPGCVIPSHGIALGGTNILQQNLEHRIMREEQVKKLFSEGVGEEQIVKLIYTNLPANLKKYALKNIKSHIIKLKIDGRII